MALVREMDFMEILQQPTPFVQKLIDIANENRELYTVLGKAALSMNQLERLKLLLVEKAMKLPQIPEKIRNQKNFAIRINFFVGGIINVYQQYLLGNLHATSEEIVDDIAILIQSSADSILKTQ